MTVLKYVKCNLCGQDNNKVLIKGFNTNLVKCKNCGLLYWNPRMTETEVVKQTQCAYDTQYVYCERIKLAKRKIFLKHIKKISKKVGKGNLLDIGCSDGFFLEIAKKYGFNIFGIEISEKEISYAKNKRPEVAKHIFNGILKDAKFQNEYFDIITLWDVIEELYYPDNELKEIKRILKKNGLIVMRLRNAQVHLWLFWINRFLKKFIHKLFMFHLYGFTNRTIRKILLKNGFKDIKVYNSELTLGDPYSQSKIGNVLTWLKIVFYYVSQILYFISFGKITISTSLIVYARKEK
jgi:2-polyprenyl-3-methyl-5-hydroxy-6-metoxy-1,4-benzoquinol methylase